MDWSQIEPVLKDVLELQPSEREAYLLANVDTDELRDEVRSLAEAYENVPGFFEDSAAEFVSPAMEADSTHSSGLTGERVGPYVIEEQIGSGGMGVVYRATRHDVGKSVALKLIRGEFLGDDDLERFVREQRVLARLEHPNIAQLVDAGVTEQGSPWFAMQLVDGVPITQFVRERRMSIRGRLELFAVVCQAVQHAHRHLVVHRDIKPSNILVTDEGRVKLLDFGIAKLLNDEADPDSAVTKTNARRLTLDYASPEQLTGGAITTASDTYALGILLYEMLAGTRPYETAGAAHTEVIRRVCEEMPPAPSTRDSASTRSEIDRDLDRVVLMTLRKEPERRYPSVDALLADVKSYLSGLPVSATPDQLTYRIRKFVGRNRVAVLTSAAAFALLAATVGLSTYRVADERDRAVLEAEKAREVTRFLVSLFEAGDPYHAQGDTVTARELMDRGLDRLDRFDEYPEVKASLLDAIGSVNRNLARFEEADANLREALEIRKRTGSPADIARGYASYAEYWLAASEYAKADSLSEMALDVARQNDVLSDIEVAELLATRGRAEWRLGEYDAAGATYAKSLEIMRQGLPPRDVRLADLLSSIAHLFLWLGETDTVHVLLEEAESIYRHTGSTLQLNEARHTLIGVLTREGRHSEAVELTEELLEENRRILGPDHPSVVSTLLVYGQLLRRAGDLEESAKVLKEVVAMNRNLQASGAGAAALGGSLIDLGSTEMRQGKLDSAEARFQEVRQIYEAEFGENHDETANLYVWLGTLRGRQGRPAESAAFYRRALAIHRAIFGEDSRFVTIDLYNIALRDHEAGDFETAEAAFREVVTRDSLEYGGRHQEVGIDLTKLGVVLSDQDKLDQAEATLARSLEILSDTLQPDHWRIGDVQMALADVDLKRGEYEQAVSRLREAVRIRSSIFEEDDPRIWEASNGLGVALALSADREEGESMAVDYYELIVERFGPDNWNARKAGSRIRLMYEVLGSPEKGRRFASLTDL